MNEQLIIKMILDSWNTRISRADELFTSLSDEQLEQETAPGRNTGTYLFGHLIAVHDAMLPLMGIGEKLYPQLEDIFIKNPDRSGIEKPAISELRNYWSELHKKISEKFDQLDTAEWLSKHTAVSDEDFEKEPHRNKLNILLTRTTHLSYHLGQLAYLSK